MAYLMGIDLGTSGTKTVLFDTDGTIVASALREYPLYQPKPGWAEQEPLDWYHAVVDSIWEIIWKNGIDADAVKGVGISGQMHGLVMIDKDGAELGRSIIWCDQRTGEECQEITDRIGAQRLIEITANPAITGFTASKILWVQKYLPKIYEKAAKLLLPKDYIRYKLTGEFATEVSDASGMQLLDISNRCWSDEMLKRLDIDKALLAPVFESCEVTGKITRQAAELTGLREGTPVVGGAGDQAAGAVGNGVVEPGIVSSTIGTSGVVFASSNEIKIDPLGRVHTFCHAVPGMWHVMGVTQGAGLSLKWFRDQFCHSELETAGLMETDPYILMDQEAGARPAGCGGLLYLPYLMGERTPHLDPDARGGFFGLTAAHTKADMLRAVMEGVAYSLRDCMEIISEMGIPISQVRASGGGGKSRLWRQMQADMFLQDIYTVHSPEGPALGVALLAGVGCGTYRSVQEACRHVIAIKDKLSPNQQDVAVYQRYYPIYQQLYPALKPFFQKMKQ